MSGLPGSCSSKRKAVQKLPLKEADAGLLAEPGFYRHRSHQGSLDILQASANNFYYGVSLADVQNFHDRHPLNSRLVKSDSGRLVGEIYRAGTPDGKIPAGRYAQFLKKANEYLEKAQAYAEPGQDQAIAALIRYYQTGDPADWVRFGAAWVQNNARVEFTATRAPPRARRGVSSASPMRN